MRYFRVILALSLLVLACSHGALAKDNGRCDERLIARIGKHFNFDHFAYPSDENGGLLVAGACKHWPSDQVKLITAFAYDSGDSRKVDDPFVYLLIAVIDWQKTEIVSSYKYKYYLDPGGIKNLKIDTAPYRLSNNVTAFGLDIKSGDSYSCGDGGTGAERTLYIQDGHQLRPILTLTMSHWSFIEEGSSRCNPASDNADKEIIENTNLYIGISSSSTKGFKDLLISAISTRNDGKPSNRKPFHSKLRFDGKEYPTQKLQNEFEKWNQRVIANK